MNCKNCGYGLKQRCGDFEKILCTYEEGECVKITELEQENAELLCQKNRNKSCYSCANATEKCFRNEISCPCQNYKSYKDENADLKEEINKIAFASGELKKENAELKERNRELLESCEGATMMYKDLCKAKEIIRDFLSVAIDYIDKEDKNYSFIVEAEQFLKDSEVKK